MLLAGAALLQPRIDRLALERKHLEDALVHAAQRFLTDEAIERLYAQGELTRRQRALAAEPPEVRCRSKHESDSRFRMSREVACCHPLNHSQPARSRSEAHGHFDAQINTGKLLVSQVLRELCLKLPLDVVRAPCDNTDEIRK